ncbi:MAG TPA: redoxin domain-containing protein [Gemmatimonadaceae bacterium]|nr:redoxin domain-containing protein [Gemmatimonadaceae bacterium]
MIKGLGATALLIGSGGIGTGLVRSLGLPYPVLVDRERTTYAAYGLSKALLILQESATFLVDREGVVRHATRALNPRESMDWDRLLHDLRALR